MSTSGTLHHQNGTEHGDDMSTGATILLAVPVSKNIYAIILFMYLPWYIFNVRPILYVTEAQAEIRL
jgi:hypothetical protein